MDKKKPAGKFSAKSTEVSAQTGDPSWIIQIIHTLLFFAGLATGFVGVFLIFSSNYSPPPVPVGYLFANVFILIGSGIAIQPTIALSVVYGVEGCRPKNAAFGARNGFVLAWGLGTVTFGFLRFGVHHPYTLSPCPCPAYHALLDGTCKSCAGFQTAVCEDAECVCGRGTCSETTAACQCEFNWQLGAPNGTCSVCSDRTMDSSAGKCTRCRERFKPNKKNGDCSLCRNGYRGTDCKVCADGFKPRRNNDGTVFFTNEGAMVCGPVFPGCQDDQPAGGGRSGSMCEPTENCAQHGDVNAFVRLTNADAALAQPATFTFAGQTCDYHHDCKSYNCQGMCSWGKGGLEGALCIEDSDCAGGSCEGRVCGLEYRVGDDDCTCSRAGYQAPRCQMCPGFNGVYAETVCGARGSCMARYKDVGLGWASEYDSLQCVCGKPTGVLTDFPIFSGEHCEKIIDENGQVKSCAEGYFGAQCDKTCEGGQGWGGVSVCNTRGACKYDAAIDEAYCSCDADMKPGGIGYFSGGGCELCAGEFYGSQCAPCPGVQITNDCGPGTFNISINPVNCFGSCVTKTCDDGKKGMGICLA